VKGQLAGAFFVLFGLAFVVIGAVVSVRGRAYRRRALTAPGVVTDLRARWTGSDAGGGPGGGTAYFPVLRFQLGDGRHAEVESFEGANPPKVRPGQPVTVLYDPADPGRAKVDDGRRGSGAWVLVAAGLLFVTVGIAGALGFLHPT
jgi:hypothetical protein